MKDVDASKYKHLINTNLTTEAAITDYVAQLEASPDLQKVSQNYLENGVQGRYVQTTQKGELVKVEVQTGYQKGNESIRYYLCRGQLVYANYSEFIKEDGANKPVIKELMIAFGQDKLFFAKQKELKFDSSARTTDLTAVPFKNVRLNYSQELQKAGKNIDRAK